MATRLIGTDSEDPRLPDVVIAATQGTTADDLASGEVYGYADSLYNALDLRVTALEGGAYVPPSSGNLLVEQSNHAHTASSPTLFTSPFIDAADSQHAHTASHVVLLPDGPVEFLITSGAPTFSPWVQLQSGSTATVTWRDSTNTSITTGLTPTIARPTNGIVRMYVTDGGLPAMNEVDYLNLGFNNDQDQGHESIGAAYNHPGQPVQTIAGIQFLTGMRYFMAANTPLRSALDMTGMTNIEFIECFHARIPTLVMTGCTSLIRLCTEGCSIATIDLSTIKNNLRDLRCAGNTDTPGVDFIVDGPMTDLWHYCVQGQTVTQHVPMAYLPIVEEYWVYFTGITNMDPPVSAVLNSCLMHGNVITSVTADAFMIALDDLDRDGPAVLNMLQAEPPSAASDTARVNLLAKGWVVDVPPSGSLGTDGTLGTWTAPITEQPWVLASLINENMSPSVTSGVLTLTNNGWGRSYFRPGGTRNVGDAIFEVEVDQSDIDPGGGGSMNFWGIFINSDSAGNGGCKVFINWPSTNSINANGVTIGASNNDSATAGAVTRIADNPAGWGAAGNHKIGIYHAANTAYVTFDGVKVYQCTGLGVETLGAGGYVGICGSSGATARIYYSWGLANVTLP